MKKKLLALILVATVSTNHSAFAETIAKPSAVDPRTRTVAYDEMQVYLIVGYYGYFTRIEFAPDETDIQFALGDESAWTVVNTGNNLLVKPSQPKPETNMTVITNRRAYNFRLTGQPTEAVRPDSEQSESQPDRKDQQYLIKFTYPKEKAKREAEEQAAKQKALAEQRLKEEQEFQKQLSEYRRYAALNLATNTVLNTEYFGCGDEEILPDAIYDNNQFTYVKFAAGTAIPAFFSTNSLGEESLVNYNVENDWIVIQKTFKELTLRNGQYAACIINANRNTERNDSGTVSPAVRRILIDKGDK